MANVTLKIDDDLLKAARKIAIDRNTTLTAMIRDYLTMLAGRERDERQRAIERLERMWDEYPVKIGKRRWSREELHER